MANANAIVEKLKELGLRHGEKAGVAIASMAFFVCVGMAANKKTIDTTPEQIKKAAQQSESNLNRPEKRETDHREARGERNQGQRFRQGGRRASQDGACRPTTTRPPASGLRPSRAPA